MEYCEKCLEEVFIPIPDYEGLYEVSNIGRIKSLKTKHKKERILVNRSGGNTPYFAVILCKNGITRTYRVHVLVAIAFLNHTPDGYNLVVDHINNVPTDNRVCNLRLIPQKENAISYRVNFMKK